MVTQDTRKPEFIRQLVSEIAATLIVTLEKLALDIHAVATYCEESGNRGFGKQALEKAERATYFLTTDAKECYLGILFLNEDSEYTSGWQCRKKPHWLDVWCARYGDLPGCEGIADDWTRIKANVAAKAAEDARPKRKSETWAGGRWVDFDTMDLGKRFAYADLMQARLHLDGVKSRMELRREGRLTGLEGFGYELWNFAVKQLSDELVYRACIGDVNARMILHFNAESWAKRMAMCERHGIKERVEESMEDCIHSARAKLLYYTQVEINEIHAGRAWPGEFMPMDPIPAVPAVVHVKSRTWSDTPEDERVYIGRNQRGFKDSGWGNPHKVAQMGRLEAIALYREELVHNAEMLSRLSELRGKRVLGCWCKSADRGYGRWHEEDQACHGDTLVELLAMGDEALVKLIEQAGGAPQGDE